MSEPTEIMVKDNGPVRVRGNCVLKDAQGQEFDISGRATVSLCRSTLCRIQSFPAPPGQNTKLAGLGGGKPALETVHSDLPRLELLKTRDRLKLLFQAVEDRVVFSPQFADEIERTPVDRARAESAHRVLVCRRAITLVAGKTVPGIGAVHRVHEAVSIDLGDDRSTGNRKIDPIPFVEAVLRLGKLGNGTAVHKNMLGRRGQRFNRQAHRLQTCMVDVETVDFLRLDDSNTDTGYRSPDLEFQGIPQIRVEPFRVVDTVDPRTGWKNDRSGNDRTRHRTDTDFIHSRNPFQPRAPEQPLEMEQPVETCLFFLLAIAALFQLSIEPLRSNSRILLKVPECGCRNRNGPRTVLRCQFL